jgi:hypothetical protein
MRAGLRGKEYRLEKTIIVKDAPVSAPADEQLPLEGLAALRCFGH